MSNIKSQLRVSRSEVTPTEFKGLEAGKVHVISDGQPISTYSRESSFRPPFLNKITRRHQGGSKL